LFSQNDDDDATLLDLEQSLHPTKGEKKQARKQPHKRRRATKYQTNGISSKEKGGNTRVGHMEVIGPSKYPKISISSNERGG
jgi:hypothetical protein